jgi:ATP-dependent DNA helicase RecQ
VNSGKNNLILHGKSSFRLSHIEEQQIYKMSVDQKLIDQILSGFERNVAQIILACLEELPVSLGVKRTIDLLKGNRSPFAINNDLLQLRTFSALSGFTRDQLSEMIDVLINHGLVDFDTIMDEEQRHPVIKINDKGKSFLGNEKAQPPPLYGILADRDVPDIPQEDQDLFYKLKLTRRQLAEDEDFPAFMVCSDAVLRAICRRKPAEPQEMEKIKGIGKNFMQQYSKPFLYVIRQHITREKGS